MTKEEYSEALKALDSAYLKNKNSIQREYAYSNSAVKIGEIVGDHIGSVVVREIYWTTDSWYGRPICIYRGQPLKKNGTETKKKELRDVYQSNLKAAPVQQTTAAVVQ